MSYPWLEAPMQALRQAYAAGRLPHALLIQDAPGAGGAELASWVAQLALCSGAEPRPCGGCSGCKRLESDQHPDLIRIRPIEDSQQIRIEQVRELGEGLALTAHQGGYKVAILEPADALNRFAANALLKTLEEPAPRTLLALVAVQPSRLPATILSRCQRIRVRPPTRAQSLEWLRQVRGEGAWESVLDLIGEAPLAAAGLDPRLIAELRRETQQVLGETLAGRADVIGTAERWSRTELPLRLACIENWLTERIRRGCGVPANAQEVRSGAHPRGGDSVMNTRALFQRLEQVRELRAALATPINRSLALESLLRSLQT